MRKIVIIVLVLILLAGTAKMILQGMDIGSLSIASVEQISTSAQNLDAQIDRINSTIKNDYTRAQTNLQTSLRNLDSSKQKYNDAITYSTAEEIRAARKMEEYKIGYLWTTIGLYATRNSVTMQANVSQGSVPGLYNISFTAIGSYISISEFIYAIENDSKLGFKIEDFTMTRYTGSSSGDSLQSTFVIRNISIDQESLTAANASYNSNTRTNSRNTGTNSNTSSSANSSTSSSTGSRN